MTDWTRAACRDDPELTHDETRVDQAKKMCAGCPLKADCRTAAADRREPWGVWGGLTVAERERLRAGGPVITCPGCGLDCVPADGDLCAGCRPAEPTPKPGQPGSSKVQPHRDLVVSLSLDHWETPDIAALIGCTEQSVRYAQRQWGLPITAAERGPRGTPKPCGTPAAIRRHYRKGERCGVCWPAAAREKQDTWAQRRERQNQLRAERRRKGRTTDREDVAA